MSIQAVLFDKILWNEKKAIQWLKDNSYNPIKPVHITIKNLRYRIADPNTFKILRTKKLKNGISLIYGYY